MASFSGVSVNTRGFPFRLLLQWSFLRGAAFGKGLTISGDTTADDDIEEPGQGEVMVLEVEGPGTSDEG